MTRRPLPADDPWPADMTDGEIARVTGTVAETINDIPPTLRQAAQALIDAFGGDCPDWLQDEYDALCDALERTDAEDQKTDRTEADRRPSGD